MRYTKQLIDRYKRFRNTSLLRHDYHAKYAFVGIGNHSMNNLYPVLAFLHVPLKYVCCKSADKLPLIERAYAGVHATTSLQEILADEEVKGVFCLNSSTSAFCNSHRSTEERQGSVYRKASLPKFGGVGATVGFAKGA